MENENEFNSLKEEDVGITEYVNKESKGFKCILKHRYSDFLVNEIDINDNVVWLKLDKKEEYEDLTTEKDILIDSEEIVDEIINNNFSFINLEDINKLKHILYKYVNKEINNDDQIMISFIDDKDIRRKFHELIRKYFDFLDSETTKLEDIKMISIFVNKNKSTFNKRRKNSPPEKYLHFSLMKRNIDTIFAVNYVARILHKTNKTVRFCGNKDKRGITTQKISIFNTTIDELKNITKKHFWDKRIEIDNYKYCKEELRLGLLKGNQFSVVFRFIEIDDNEIEENMKTIGFINYFGMQRFGVSSVPTHEIGKYVIKKQWKEVIENILRTTMLKEVLLRNDYNYNTWIKDEMPNISQILKDLPKYSFEFKILSHIKTNKSGYLNAFRLLNKQLQVLYPHAYQSFIWNRTVSERLKKYGLNVLIGDVVKKTNVINPNENINLEELINDDNYEDQEIQNNIDDIYEYVNEDNLNKYSIYDVVIPLVGLKSKYPLNETNQFTLNFLKEDGISIDDFITGNFKGEGHYRKIIERPIGLKYEIVRHDDPDIDLQNEYYNVNFHPIETGKKFKSIRTQFQLPQSTYATMLFRELTKESSSVLYQSNLSNAVKNK